MAIQIDIKKNYSHFNFEINLQNTTQSLAILGPSGAGKTMLLRCIAGLITPDEGYICIDDHVLFDKSKNINLPPSQRKVGFLFQNYCLFPHMTVYDNIAFSVSKTSDALKIHHLLDAFKLSSISQNKPSEISGGQQQRVALARAIATDPDILLFDEPFSALDNHLKVHMIERTIRDLSGFKGTTLVVSHNIDEAYRLCDDIAIIKAGKMIACDRKKKFFETPTSESSARITGCKNIIAARRRGTDFIFVPDWGITLKTCSTYQEETGVVAVRANHIQQAKSEHTDNIVEVTIEGTIETPFRITLLLATPKMKLKNNTHYIHWEISQEAWHVLKNQSEPLKIHLPIQSTHYLMADAL